MKTVKPGSAPHLIQKSFGPLARSIWPGASAPSRLISITCLLASLLCASALAVLEPAPGAATGAGAAPGAPVAQGLESAAAATLPLEGLADSATFAAQAFPDFRNNAGFPQTVLVETRYGRKVLAALSGVRQPSAATVRSAISVLAYENTEAVIALRTELQTMIQATWAELLQDRRSHSRDETLLSLTQEDILFLRGRNEVPERLAALLEALRASGQSHRMTLCLRSLGDTHRVTGGISGISGGPTHDRVGANESPFTEGTSLPVDSTVTTPLSTSPAEGPSPLDLVEQYSEQSSHGNSLGQRLGRVLMDSYVRAANTTLGTRLSDWFAESPLSARLNRVARSLTHIARDAYRAAKKPLLFLQVAARSVGLGRADPSPRDLEALETMTQRFALGPVALLQARLAVAERILRGRLTELNQINLQTDTAPSHEAFALREQAYLAKHLPPAVFEAEQMMYDTIRTLEANAGTKQSGVVNEGPFMRYRQELNDLAARREEQTTKITGDNERLQRAQRALRNANRGPRGPQTHADILALQSTVDVLARQLSLDQVELTAIETRFDTVDQAMQDIAFDIYEKLRLLDLIDEYGTRFPLPSALRVRGNESRNYWATEVAPLVLSRMSNAGVARITGRLVRAARGLERAKIAEIIKSVGEINKGILDEPGLRALAPAIRRFEKAFWQQIWFRALMALSTVGGSTGWIAIHHNEVVEVVRLVSDDLANTIDRRTWSAAPVAPTPHREGAPAHAGNPDAGVTPPPAVNHPNSPDAGNPELSAPPVSPGTDDSDDDAPAEAMPRIRPLEPAPLTHPVIDPS